MTLTDLIPLARRIARRRSSRVTVVLLALAVLGVYGRDSVARARKWVSDVDVHVHVEKPEAVKRFEALERKVEQIGTDMERKVDALATDVGAVKTDVRDIRNALMQGRHTLVIPSPTPAPLLSWVPSFLPAASAAEAVP